jgi:hypothetical protein
MVTAVAARHRWRHAALVPILALGAVAAMAAALGADAAHPARHAAALPETAAVVLGRAVLGGVEALTHTPGPAAHLPAAAAAVAASAIIYVATTPLFGRAAGALSTLFATLAPLVAVSVRQAGPSVFTCLLGAAALAALRAPAAGRARPAWLAAALLAAGALVPLAALAPPHARHATLVTLSLVGGGALAGVFAVLRAPRAGARRRGAAACLVAVLALLALYVLAPGLGTEPLLFALAPAALLFGSGIAAMARAIGRRGPGRYALALWTAMVAAGQFALVGALPPGPILSAAALAVAFGAAAAIVVGRLPLFDTPNRAARQLPVAIALAAVLAVPAVHTARLSVAHAGAAHAQRGWGDGAAR